MKPFVRLALVLCCLPALAGLEVHLDENADFGALESYRWIEGVPAQKGGVERQVRESVDAQLEAQGLRRVEDGVADLDVATYVLTSMNVDLWSATATTTWGRAWSIQVRDITHGTLVVRLTRSGTQDMVWHAMMEAIVEPGQTSQQLERKVDRVIQKMFKKYPRTKKK